MPQAVLHTEANTTLRKLHLALELSATQWMLAFSDGGVTRPKIHVVDAGDFAAFDTKVKAARKAFGLPNAPAVSCYEAGRDGFWIHRALEQRGIKNTVVDPACLARTRVGRTPKTDRLDARALVQMLVRAERGEAGVWRVARVPSEEVEDKRRLSRYRQTLLKERGQHANRIVSKLLTVGIRVAHSGAHRIQPQHLEDWKQFDGKPLPAMLIYELRLELERLALVRKQLAEVDKKLKGATASDPLSKALMSLKGVGEKSAQVLSAEFFGWRDFKNQREVGALAGLVGTPHRSGSLARDQGISKAGNRRVRGTMVELAWFWLRHQPTSVLSTWFKARVGEKPTSRQKRVAIVALARKLLVALWRFTKHGELPKGAELKAA